MGGKRWRFSGVFKARVALAVGSPQDHTGAPALRPVCGARRGASRSPAGRPTAVGIFRRRPPAENGVSLRLTSRADPRVDIGCPDRSFGRITSVRDRPSRKQKTAGSEPSSAPGGPCFVRGGLQLPTHHLPGRFRHGLQVDRCCSDPLTRPRCRTIPRTTPRTNRPGIHEGGRHAGQHPAGKKPKLRNVACAVRPIATATRNSTAGWPAWLPEPTAVKPAITRPPRSATWQAASNTSLRMRAGSFPRYRASSVACAACCSASFRSSSSSVKRTLTTECRSGPG